MAADQCAVTFNLGRMPMRTSTNVRKIFWDEGKGVACCFSGDQCAERVADDLVEAVRNGQFDRADTKTELERIANARSQKELARLGRNWNSQAARAVFVVFCDKQEGWMLQVSDDSFAQLVNPYGTVHIGDIGNPAVFFAERYHPAHLPVLRPVRELIFLAAHCVLEASSFSPRGIFGLDVLIFQHGRFHWLNDAEVVDLKTRSKALADAICTTIFR